MVGGGATRQATAGVVEHGGFKLESVSLLSSDDEPPAAAEAVEGAAANPTEEEARGEGGGEDSVSDTGAAAEVAAAPGAAKHVRNPAYGKGLASSISFTIASPPPMQPPLRHALKKHGSAVLKRALSGEKKEDGSVKRRRAD